MKTIIKKDWNNNTDIFGVRQGFTLVELSLSLVFISTLSLTVVFVIAGAVSSYHKSITMNQINTTGTNLEDDMRIAVSESSSSKLENLCDRVYKDGNADCVDGGAKRFVSVTKRSTVKSKSSGVWIADSENPIPVFGAFCTGTYSYIWNSGYYSNSDYEVGVARASLKYNGDKTRSGFKLLKIQDENRAVCVAAVRVQSNRVTNNYKDDNIQSEFNIALSGLIGNSEAVWVEEEPLEMISGGEDGLALYDFVTAISEQKGTSKNIFYYTSFILGTVQGGVNVNSNNDYCKAPEDYSGLIQNFDYCAINKFNFAALANGGKQ